MTRLYFSQLLSGRVVGRFVALFMLLCFVNASALAAPISMDEAQERAEKFLINIKGSRKLTPITSSRKLAPANKGGLGNSNLYYVFNRGIGEGYVIMAGDDQFDSPLGYTDSGEFDYNAIPDNMRYWLDSYAEYIRQLQSTSNAMRKVIPTHPAIAPLLTTTWNQGYPYNNECPMYFSLGRSVTGCVATAMAQVLYHQRDKSVDEIQADIPGYTTYTSHPTYGQLQVEGIPAGSPIDWANMLNNYNGGGSAKQQLAVAQLMHYCGVSVEMDYTNSASGAQSYKVSEAMNKYFGYSTATYIQRYNYTDENWDATIYNELEQGRVVYLSGANSEAGHAFVTDGYDGNHCYHINWGWGGASNGYFLLSSLNPSSQGIGGSGDGYNTYQDAVIGCEPDNYGEKEMPISSAVIKKICLENWDSNGDGKFTYGEAAAVTEIGKAFKGIRVNSFTELYYFTSLKAIPDSAFYGCVTLTAIKLPKNIESIGAQAFNGCRTLKTFKLPDHVNVIGKGAFAGCRVLPDQTLPAGLTAITDSTFAGCSSLTNLSIPANVKYIGTQAFSQCTKLLEFTVSSMSPENIVLGTDVFEGIALKNARLNVPQGTKTYFSTADQWKEFGSIYEERSLSGGKFIPLAVNTDLYIYNEGTGRYLTKGEAWGTQAVVGDNDPMRFQLKHTSNMPEGVYYLYSADTGNDRHILFRTSNDDNVGVGVKACFVDGEASHIIDKTSWWKVNQTESGYYTFQIPESVSGYDKEQFLGVQTSHESNAASPTYGAYSDVIYSGNEAGCQWMFVEYNPDAEAIYLAAQELGNLLECANGKNIDTSVESAVFYDMESTLDDILSAQKTLRKKLGFINFKDEIFKSIAIGNWDVDKNGELSFSEASKVTDFGYYAFYGQDFKDMSDLQYFNHANMLYGNSFEGSKSLSNITLPKSITTIYYRVFKDCTSLKTIELPEHIQYLGSMTFSGCTALKDVTILNPNPDAIFTAEDLFDGLKTNGMTLYVPYGSKEAYSQAPVWKEFGNIVEVRGPSQPKFSPIEENTLGYVYNVGEHKYITQGEAWGTQAIVAATGFQYQFRRNKNMPEGTYYLYSTQAGNDHVLFRTDADPKVGEGVKACFVDGSLTTKAYWTVEPIGENIYTLQVPSTDTQYTEGEYLGVEGTHYSGYESPTFGLYWDVTADAGKGIQWAFVSKADLNEAESFDELVAELKQLLSRANAKSIDVNEEQAVYDNIGSSADELSQAIKSVRGKLHYIDFADARSKTICTNMWDTDDDGELSMEEAAAVTDIGTQFSKSTIKSLEELRYFTSITSIPDDAFTNCTSLTSLYIPENVSTIGTNAFKSCSALKYVAILHNEMVNADDASLPRNSTIFVPKALMDAYSQSAAYERSVIVEYTGTPVITAEDNTKVYGRNNPKFTFAVSGAPINGEPTLEVGLPTDDEGNAYTEPTMPVGDYVIVVNADNITSANLQVVNGKMTVEPAPLTITAKSYTRNIGEANPEFEVTYKGFKNRETAATALTAMPTITCEANENSPGGKYDIVVSSAEARNYEITYENGVLTVIAPVGISNVTTSDNDKAVYDLQGRRVSKPSKGLYIIDGKKLMIK